MIRRIALCVLAISACAAIVVWVIARDTSLHKIEYHWERNDLSLAVNRGGFYVNHFRESQVPELPRERWLVDFDFRNFPYIGLRWCVDCAPLSNATSHYNWFFSELKNLWGVAAALGIWPLAAFVRGPVKRWRWRRRGCCPSCGYNLTGNVSGVCPECSRPCMVPRLSTPNAVPRSDPNDQGST